MVDDLVESAAEPVAQTSSRPTEIERRLTSALELSASGDAWRALTECYQALCLNRRGASTMNCLRQLVEDGGITQILRSLLYDISNGDQPKIDVCKHLDSLTQDQRIDL